MRNKLHRRINPYGPSNIWSFGRFYKIKRKYLTCTYGPKAIPDVQLFH